MRKFSFSSQSDRDNECTIVARNTTFCVKIDYKHFYTLCIRYVVPKSPITITAPVLNFEIYLTNVT
jgi:hypothetical protein